MIQGRESSRLALEARKPLRIAREDPRQDFDRDLSPQLGVARAVDLAHRACAQARDQLVGPEAVPHKCTRVARHSGFLYHVSTWLPPRQIALDYTGPDSNR